MLISNFPWSMLRQRFLSFIQFIIYLYIIINIIKTEGPAEKKTSIVKNSLYFSSKISFSIESGINTHTHTHTYINKYIKSGTFSPRHLPLTSSYYISFLGPKTTQRKQDNDRPSGTRLNGETSRQIKKVDIFTLLMDETS